MIHIEKALNKMKASHYSYTELDAVTGFINLTNVEDKKGIAPVISFTIQSDPIREVGINGLQVTDMLEYVKCLFETLNEVFPCRENELTITKIEEALHWQEHRTKDRLKRLVEGKNQA